MKIQKTKLIFLFLLILFSHTADAKSLLCQIAFVIDGDTFICNHKYTQIRVRLEDIDAPELDTHYGKFARKSLQKLLPQGLVVNLKISGLDFYDRSLATVFLPNSTNVNAKLIQIGAAKIFYKYLHKSRKNYYKKLEKQARTRKVGIWQKPKLFYRKKSQNPNGA